MKRRCSFLDDMPAFNYNTGVGEVIKGQDGKNIPTDTRCLGSTLMSTMLEEVENFCGLAFIDNWTETSCQRVCMGNIFSVLVLCSSSNSFSQLIYDFKDGGGSFGLLSLRPEQLSDEERSNFERIGFQLPSKE